MKKLIAILLALSVVGVFVAGCSSDDEGGDDAESSTDSGDGGDN